MPAARTLAICAAFVGWWDQGQEITVDVGGYDRLAREIASYGPDAVVLAPRSLRDDVVARLRAQAGVGHAS